MTSARVPAARSAAPRAGYTAPIDRSVLAEHGGELPLARAGDRARCALVTAGLLVLTALPYLFGYLSAPADRQFMGIVLNVPDTAQYLAWAREFGQGWLIENRLTPERGEASFFNLFWLAVGRLASLLGLAPAEALQLARPIAGALYLGAIYWFVGLVTRERRQRWTAFLVIALGGGLGWTLVVLKQFTGVLQFPLDLYVAESNTFLTVMAFPHQAMAGALLVLILGVAALAFERDRLLLAGGAGLLTVALGLQHGYDLIVVYAVVGTTAALLVLQGRAWRRVVALCVVACGPSVPVAAYLVFLTRASPIWSEVLAQYGNAGVYTPSPPHLLVLLGLPLALVLVGLPGWVRQAGRSREQPWRSGPRDLLLGVWLVVGFLLLYIPTDFQIKMLGGWQVPVGVVATRVLFARIAPWLGRAVVPDAWRSGAWLGALFVLAVLPTNLYLYAWRFVDLGRHDYPYYLHRDEVVALRWLEAHAGPDDVVLSSLTIGQYVPSVAGTRPFLAHWAQTLDYQEKRRLVARFFDPSMPEAERRALMARFRVRYVFWGEPERALGAYDPGRSPGLRRVLATSQASIYEVQQ